MSHGTSVRPLGQKWRAFALFLSFTAFFTVVFTSVAFAQAVGPALADPAAGPPDLCSPGNPDRCNAQSDTRIPGRYIVVLKDSVDHPANVAEAQTERREGELGLVYRHALNGYSVGDLSKEDVELLRSDPRVKYVTPDREAEVFSQAIPSGIERVYATESATADIDGKDDARVNVDAAVIDSGIDHTHPDLNVYKRVNCVPPGEGFLGGGEGKAEECTEGSGSDGLGHGTHVAGTLAAIDNGEGVAGVAPGARLWAIKVLRKDGRGTASWIIAGVDWVTAHASEVEVANMSLGFIAPQPAVEEAVSAAVSAGVVLVVAAGNETWPADWISPAKNPDVITVSALADYDGEPGGQATALKPGKCTEPDESGEASYGEDDTLAWFSNWGTLVEAVAPGVCILSSVPGGGYAFKTGTSMSSPHVAGAAALLASKSNPGSKKDVEAIRQQIVDAGNQHWTDVWTFGDQGVAFNEGSFDQVQEPLVDVGPAGPATYTTRATKRSFNSATLNGGLNPSGKAMNYQFEYGTSTAYGSKVPASAKSAGSGSKDLKVSEALTGLTPNTVYHYRLVTSTAEGTVYGADRTFTPTRSFFTSPAANIEASTATLKGMLNPSGLETGYQFQYVDDAGFKANGWTNAAKAPASPKGVGSGSEWLNVSEAVTGLKPSTTYHYRLTITNKNGTFHGDVHTFSTPLAVMTGEATGVDAHRARLEARINPMGLATSYRFEWGSGSEYGNSAPASPKSIGSGTKAVKVSELLEGLKADTTYHFRVAAISEKGTTYGADEVVTTTTSGFAADSYPATLKGQPCQNSTLYCNPIVRVTTRWDSPWSGPDGLGSLVCDVPPFAATMDGPSESITTTSIGGPTAKCVPANSLFGGEGTLTAANCQFEFHPGYTDELGEVYEGSFDIGGTNCSIRATWGSGPSFLCDITIGPQRGLDARAEPLDGEAPLAAFDVLGLSVWSGGLEYTQNGSACTDGTFDVGFLYAGWNVLAESKANVPIDVSLTDRFKVVPQSSTGPATNVGTDQATLHAAIDPNLLETTYQFEYTTATDYLANGWSGAATAPASPKSVGAGEAGVEVSETVSGLDPHTAYQFRVVAENAEGTDVGEEETFRTLPHHVARIEAESYLVTLAGEQDPADEHLLTFNGGRKLECDEVFTDAETSGAAHDLALDVDYANCESVLGGGAFQSATVATNSCHYLLHVQNAGPPYAGTLDVACANAGDAIELIVWNSGSKLCTYKIAPQKGLKTVGLGNFGSASERGIDLDLGLEAVAYTRTSGVIPNCGTSTGNATYAGTTVLGGASEAEDPVGVYLTAGEPSIGIFLAGEESGEEAKQPKLEAESYPVTIAGEQDPADEHLLTFNGGRKFECDEVFTDAETSGAAHELTLDVEYANCESVLGSGAHLAATVETNSCHFVLHAQNVGPPYAGTLDVACANEGDAIELTAWYLGDKHCTYKIGPQKGLKTVGLGNFGSASERGIDLDLSLEAVAYTRTSGVIPNCGTSTGNATYGGTTTLFGF